eukprot:tig00021569_g22339.t1
MIGSAAAALDPAEILPGDVFTAALARLPALDRRSAALACKHWRDAAYASFARDPEPLALRCLPTPSPFLVLGAEPGAGLDLQALRSEVSNAHGTRGNFSVADGTDGDEHAASSRPPPGRILTISEAISTLRQPRFAAIESLSLEVVLPGIGKRGGLYGGREADVGAVVGAAPPSLCALRLEFFLRDAGMVLGTCSVPTVWRYAASYDLCRLSRDVLRGIGRSVAACPNLRRLSLPERFWVATDGSEEEGGDDGTTAAALSLLGHCDRPAPRPPDPARSSSPPEARARARAAPSSSWTSSSASFRASFCRWLCSAFPRLRRVARAAAPAWHLPLLSSCPLRFSHASTPRSSPLTSPPSTVSLELHYVRRLERADPRCLAGLRCLELSPGPHGAYRTSRAALVWIGESGATGTLEALRVSPAPDAAPDDVAALLRALPRLAWLSLGLGCEGCSALVWPADGRGLAAARAAVDAVARERPDLLRPLEAEAGPERVAQASAALAAGVGRRPAHPGPEPEPELEEAETGQGTGQAAAPARPDRARSGSLGRAPSDREE